MDVTFFTPRISADTKAFWDACREHKLAFQKCSVCGTVRWPAGYLCPECLSEQLTMTELPQEGAVESFIVFQKPFHPSLQETVPYITATVNLADGVRIVTNIVNSNPDKVRCGARVRLIWIDSETYTRPAAELMEDETR